jgi:predicted acetylornithine/succinylornithine family transaminase
MAHMGNAELIRRTGAALVGNYARQPLALVRGEGVFLWDADGRRYLDMMGGIATTVLGHCHPRVLAALESQARELWHVSNLFHARPPIELAERLCAHSFAERVFFCNSGAEANEAALKLARRFAFDRGQGRFEIVVFDRAFHGRTLFTLSATPNPAYQKGFGPLVPGIREAVFGDLASVEAVLGPQTAAILVEPVQGEGGVRAASRDFLAGLRALADRNGCLLVFDEIQCGMGRTGSLFAYQHYGVEPDLLTLAKALGNGIPIGAVLARAEVAASLVPGTHGSTFGGNLLATACGVAVLDELTEGGVLEHARRAAARLDAGLVRLASRAGSRVREVRGLGLLRGIEIDGEAAKVIDAARAAGLLVISAGASVLRLAPALIIGEAQIDEGLEILERALRG